MLRPPAGTSTFRQVVRRGPPEDTGPSPDAEPVMIALALASLALLAAAPFLAPHPETGTFDGLAEALAALLEASPENRPDAA